MTSTWSESPTPAELAAIEAPLTVADARAVGDYWERVIRECGAVVEDAPRPTSWLVSSTAEQRQVRRETRRLATAAVRELPVRQAVVPTGTEAA